MSATKILIAAAVAAILSTLACAMPRQIRSIPQNNENQINIQRRDLNEILNKTVCPIKVDYDVDESRVPRRIKIMKCAEQPSYCSEKHRAHECCKLEVGNKHHLACVEIIDQVLVFYKDNTNGTLNVSVGCSCLINDVSETSTRAGHN